MVRDRKDAQGQAENPEWAQRLAGLPEQNPHPVLICLGPGRLTYGNPAAEALVANLGLESARELLPEDHRQIKRACLEANQPRTAEVAVANRVITWSYRPIEAEGVVHLYGVDITEHRRSKDETGARTLPMAALDRMSTGVVAVDKSLRILFSNSAADGLLADHDGLGVRDGRMAAAISQVTVRLTQMVEAVITGPQESSSALSVPRASGRSPIELLVSPLAAGSDGNSNTAVVFLFDADSRGDSITDVLMSLFRLTPGEARLVELLTGGMSLKDAAISLGISKTTARNRLQDVFNKTGTHRQADLMNRIQAGPAGQLFHGRP